MQMNENMKSEKDVSLHLPPSLCKVIPDSHGDVRKGRQVRGWEEHITYPHPHHLLPQRAQD